MVIPTHWLEELESMEEVEEWLATRGAPDLWLEEWRRFVGHFEPDDELWSYFGADWRAGYARVRDGEAVESISTACPWFRWY